MFGYVARGTVGRGVAAGQGTRRAFAACWRTNGSREGGGAKKKKRTVKPKCSGLQHEMIVMMQARVEGLKM